MQLSPYPGGEPLSVKDAFIWETVTEDFIKKHLLSNDVNPPIRDLDDVIASMNQLSSTDAQADFLNIIFDIEISYRSESDGYDAKELVYSAFDSPSKSDEYIKELRDKSSTFSSLKQVEVTVEGYVPNLIQDSSNSNIDKVDIAVIVGASVGGAASIILLLLLFLRRRGGKGITQKETQETHTTPSTNKKNIKVSTEILVEPQDDISTLGDPMFGMVGMDAAKDDKTARYVDRD